MSARPLTAVDADAMARIHAASFAKAWATLDMSVHVKRDMCLGVGDPLAAFAILRPSDVDAEILTIATEPASRGQGLAGEILATAHAILAGQCLRHVFLEVAEDNLSAQSLYKKFGYQQIGRRPAYYARPTGRMAALTFSYDLQEP